MNTVRKMAIGVAMTAAGILLVRTAIQEYQAPRFGAQEEATFDSLDQVPGDCHKNVGESFDAKVVNAPCQEAKD